MVQVESYIEKPSDHLRKHYEPHLSITFRERLIEEIKAVHTEMLQLPDKVKANPKWLQQWQLSIKRDIDWAGVMDAGSSTVGFVNEAGHARKSDEEEEEDTTDASTTAQEPEFLTVGLIGRILRSYLASRSDITAPQGNLTLGSRPCSMPCLAQAEYEPPRHQARYFSFPIVYVSYRVTSSDRRNTFKHFF